MRRSFSFLLTEICFLALTGCVDDSVHRGMDCLRLGDYEMAKSFFSEQIRNKPTHFEARVGMGQALLQEAHARKNDTTLWLQALVHLEAARSIDSRDFLSDLLSEAWLLYARAKLDTRDTLAALSALTYSLDYDSGKIETLNLAAILYSSYGHVVQAESLFVKALTLDSLQADILFNIGLLCWYRKDPQRSIFYWRRLLELDSTDLRTRHWIALAEKQKGGLQQ